MLLKPKPKKFFYAPTVFGRAAGGGGYTGPGDIVAFNNWWGIRAYSAAKAAALAPIVDLVDQAGANPITINSTTAGALDATAIATWVAAHSVTTIKVKQLYDQTATANNLMQATLANMPNLVANGPNSNYALNFATASNQSMGNVSAQAAQAQPTFFTYATYWDGAAQVDPWSADDAGAGGNGQLVDFQPNGGSPLVEIFAGSSGATASTTANAWHAYQALFNGASSVNRVDATETAVSPGANPAFASGSTTFTLGKGIVAAMAGRNLENGYIANGALATSGIRNSLNSDMRAAYGGW